MSVHSQNKTNIGELAERLYKHLTRHKVPRTTACTRVASYYSLRHAFDNKGRCEMCRGRQADHLRVSA